MNQNDRRLWELWMGLVHPFYASLPLAAAITHASLAAPAYVGCAWHIAWLELMAEAARQSEKPRDKS